MSKHPEVLWAQRSSESDKEKNLLFVTVNLPDIVASSIQYDLQPTGLVFKAQAGPGEQKSDFEFKVDFYKEIIPEESKKHLTSRSVVLNLRKKVLEQEYWPRLTKDKVKSPYIKTDFSKWVDEDEQESPSTALDEEMMGGGMPGMGGGMPGMGGIPGLGDLGGGDMDFSKMMASMGNAGLNLDSAGDDGAPAPEGGADSDSDSDSGPPPLE
ncbi:HSP20-like chaperone [Lactarius pseudohatsudake]|nr:HSP20-like chaperone [Lactarius pseudohatsudake]